MIQVEHKKYGRGNVGRQRYGGFEYNIQFADGISRWVRRDEISLLTEPAILPKHKKHVSNIPQDQFLARKAIEALRLGIVPHDSLENFTIGRDKEIRALEKWFDNKNKGSIFIRGEYGSGKSHLLEYTQIWALKNGWATANIEIGLEENPFHKPYQLYREVVKNFRCNYEGKVLGFRDVMRYIVQSKSEFFETHLYFGELQAQFEKLEQINQNPKRKKKHITEEKIWEWIEGEHNWIKPSLSQTGTAANIYCNILNGLSWAVSNILDLKGLVILFDEAEHIDEAAYRYQSITGASFLNGIISVAENRKSLLAERISPDKKRGYDTGLIYCGYPRNNPLRYAWQYPSGLKVIFAMTPVQEHTEMIDLQMLRNDDLLTITYNVAQFYKNAYGFEISDEVLNRMFKKLPRQRTRLFIKYCVEALDVLRFNPGKSFKDILK